MGMPRSAMPSIPPPDRIETTRLVLRTWRMEEAPLLRAALNESVDHLRPWIPWAKAQPTTVEDARARVAEWTGKWQKGEEFVYAVFDTAETRLIGGAGLFPRVARDGLEIGYWIRLGEVGWGYATEATHALTKVGLRVPGVVRIQIHCDPANLPSRRVPERLGYRLVEPIRTEREPDGTLRETVVYEMMRGSRSSLPEYGNSRPSPSAQAAQRDAEGNPQ